MYVSVGVMTCVTGVSGSGKSSLVIETLYKQAVNHLHGAREMAGACKLIKGLDLIDKVPLLRAGDDARARAAAILSGDRRMRRNITQETEE